MALRIGQNVTVHQTMTLVYCWVGGMMGVYPNEFTRYIGDRYHRKSFQQLRLLMIKVPLQPFIIVT